MGDKDREGEGCVCGNERLLCYYRVGTDCLLSYREMATAGRKLPQPAEGTTF